MRIGGEDYTTNNGIKVNQDTLESCVGRVGFEMGKTISDKGSIYAKAHCCMNLQVMPILI